MCFPAASLGLHRRCKSTCLCDPSYGRNWHYLRVKTLLAISCHSQLDLWPDIQLLHPLEDPYLWNSLQSAQGCVANAQKNHMGTVWAKVTVWYLAGYLSPPRATLQFNERLVRLAFAGLAKKHPETAHRGDDGAASGHLPVTCPNLDIEWDHGNHTSIHFKLTVNSLWQWKRALCTAATHTSTLLAFEVRLPEMAKVANVWHSWKTLHAATNQLEEP
jgi:hypothetical protein